MSTACATEYEAPHQTREPWPFVVTYRGQPTTVGVDACILPARQEPTDADWHAALVLDDNGTPRTHVLVAGLTPTWYDVWARITRGDWSIVLYLGQIHLT